MASDRFIARTGTTITPSKWDVLDANGTLLAGEEWNEIDRLIMSANKLKVAATQSELLQQTLKNINVWLPL